MPSRSGSRKSSCSSQKSSFKSASILEQGGRPPLRHEDTPPPSNTASQDEMELVPGTSPPDFPHLPHPSDPRSPPSVGATSTPAAIAPVAATPEELHNQGESTGIRINFAAARQRDRLPHTRLGLKTDQSHGHRPQGGLRTDYKQKYPEDPIYKETEENARVFHVYNDESQIFDNDMILEAGDSLDILLVFAGLFASVLTTVVVQTSQALSPNKTDISNSLLREMIALQRAQENGTSFSSVPPADTSFVASRSDIWINSLWFVSLALGLSTALLAVIAKQWLRQYSTFISGTPRERTLIRQFRYDGLEKWRVRLIIGLLPTILHIALFLFLAGLVVFLSPLNSTLARIVAGIAGFLCAAYIITNILPVIFIQCPYRTPLSEISNTLWGTIKMILQLIWSFAIDLLEHMNVVEDSFDWIPHSVRIYQLNSVMHWPTPLKEVERAHANVKDRWGNPRGITGALLWLAQTTSDTSAKAIVAEAVGSISHPLLTSRWTAINDVIIQHWKHIHPQIRAGKLFAEDERIVERLLRSAFMTFILIRRMYQVEEAVYCQAHSTMLMLAAHNFLSRFHPEDGESQDLVPDLVLSFIPGSVDELEAPSWIWWMLFAQAAGAVTEDSFEQMPPLITYICKIGITPPHLDSHREEWLNKIDIPETLRYTVRDCMVDAYSAAQRVPVERPVSPHMLSRLSEFFVARANEFKEFKEEPPSPFSPVSLGTFLFDNFAQFTYFWMETGDVHSHIQSQSSTDDSL